MTPTGHINHNAERAFWMGPRALEINSNVTAEPESVVASRPEHSDLPSDGPAGREPLGRTTVGGSINFMADGSVVHEPAHPCQREL